MEQKSLNNQQRGFIAMTTVLIMGVVVLAISMTVSLTSIGEAQQGLATYLGEEGLVFVEGCVEDALLKARADNGYNGGTIIRPEGTCSISISKAGVTWTMDATTTGVKYKRTVRVVFDRNPSGITLTSWNEI